MEQVKETALIVANSRAAERDASNQLVARQRALRAALETKLLELVCLIFKKNLYFSKLKFVFRVNNMIFY